METSGTPLPDYSKPGAYLGGQSFHLDGVEFPHGMKPGAAKRAGTYAWWQIGTAYVVPFVFDPDAPRKLSVFLLPRDRDAWWMFGDEIEAGERVGDMLVACLRDQAGLTIEDEQRTRFLDLDKAWDLMRMITPGEDKPPVPRHELARVFGYAVAPSEMVDVRTAGNGQGLAGRWVNILSDVGIEFAKAEMDPALQSILAKLTSCVLNFHGIKHS